MTKKNNQNPKTMSPAKPQFEKASAVKWVSFWKSKKNVLFLSAILIISFMAYLPSLQNGFVNWDDNFNIYQNPHITNISTWESFVESVKGIFTTGVNGNYNPLSILSFAFEKMIYGLDNPEWWHLDNIILHLICVLLVFRIALALGLKLIPAAFCALLFGIQPMRVESVAWITERKDVLFGSFYLLALYYYIKSVKLSFRKRYQLIILASFILALLSKIQAVALPLSMLLVDYYFDRKLSMKLVYEKWLYFLLSLITGIVGIYFLRVIGALENEIFPPYFKRMFLGSYSYIVYIIKSVVPYRMVPAYFYPDEIGWMVYASMVPALSIIGLIYYFFLQKKKVIVFGLLFFTFNIMFLLQIISAGQGLMADRFTYIAYLGLFFIYAFGVQWALEKYGVFNKLIYLAALLILGVFGYITYEQNKLWKNGETLWSHELKYYPRVPLAWAYRGHYYKDEGRFKEALHDYNNGIAVKPDNPRAYYNRGNLYSSLISADPDALRLALNDYTKAIQLSPGTSEYLVNRGAVYIKINMFDNALQDFNAAERIDPTDHYIYHNRSTIYINLGQYDKAQPDLEKYLNLNPYNPDMWSKLGMVSRLNLQYENSLNAFNRAIQINPDRLSYYSERLKTYYEMGDIQRARNDLDFLKLNGFKDIPTGYEWLINQGK